MSKSERRALARLKQLRREEEVLMEKLSSPLAFVAQSSPSAEPFCEQLFAQFPALEAWIHEGLCDFDKTNKFLSGDCE